MHSVQSNLAREVCRLHHWSDRVWSRRYRSICVSEEEEAQIERMRYLFEQGCKENLVLSPRDWPGASCVNTLVSGYRFQQGDWYDRTGLYRARYRGQDLDLDDFTEHVDLPLVSLPCWQRLSREEYAKECLDLVEMIEVDTRTRHENNGTTILGAPAILSTDPHKRPNKLKNTSAPLVHAHDRAERAAMVERYRQFTVLYWSASADFRAGQLDVEFPEGSFRPAAPYVGRARAPD